jgi:signal peptidase II
MPCLGSFVLCQIVSLFSFLPQPGFIMSINNATSLSSRLRTNFSWMLFVLVIIIVDRLTKVLALQHLVMFEPRSLLPFFNLALTYNTGAAFSFLQGAAGGWQNWLFSTVAIIVSAFLVWQLWCSSYMQRNASLLWQRIGMSLVLGGALGNLYDRIVYQRVIDFLDFYVKHWHWPTFNIADSAICVGITILCIRLLSKPPSFVL